MILYQSTAARSEYRSAQRRKIWFFIPKVLISGVLLLLLSGCTSMDGMSAGQFPNPVTQGDETLLWGPEIKPEALKMIDQSTSFCHLTMYELSDPNILQALLRAKVRGVDVEVVLDATEPHSQSVALPFLQAHQIKVRTLSISGGISHIKSLVVMTHHGMQALLGGMNFGTYSWENHDASVYFTHPSPEFEGLFEQDYARAGGNPEVPVAYPLPLRADTQIEPALLLAIASAKEEIDMEAFAFTSRELVAALSEAVARGVKVRVVLDAKQHYNHKTARLLANAGIDVRYYQPYDNEYLHAKILSVDNGRIVFIGSANFSYHGFSVNHEGDVELMNAFAFGKSIKTDVDNQFTRS
ncbi:phospholipase D-like domain-containing protein [Sulfoacidibacillus thermotolerans]|uniref:phospholipase D n=1 Tax=Sulfoacidibacillus thermotolerans TaxID=1765684 RepID=A0A2U3DCE9_SULT2|nr:phospholipase D-like domain-containing protein [Sulfoacidibacillus thermotolerans]PWI58960.1 hypothetical protein BM613_02495 [Sulfoacidibacillus thermotolerans]